MHNLGHLNKHNLLPELKIRDNKDLLKNNRVETVDETQTPKYTIEEILDRVEEGDVSILVELGISYTEITTETGEKQISFQYEETRYTVHVIDSTQGNDGVDPGTNRTETVKNDDGSYIVYEYGTDGSLLKSTEYDKDGIIKTVREFNENGYKAYYYQNGIKTTEVNIDNQGHPYYQLDFDTNGNVIRIWETEWNEDGSMVGTCKTPDGKMISLDKTDSQGRGIYAERYEDGKLNKTIETDYLENGVSRQIERNSLGEITWIIYWQDNGQGASVLKSAHEGDKNFLEELKKLANDYQKQLNSIEVQIRSLTAPVPPSLSDYVTSDGDADIEAFDEAMKQYNKQQLEYHTKINELRKESMETQNKLNKVNQQIAEIETKNRIASIEETINSLKDSPNTNNDLISLLKANLSNIKQNLSDLSSKRLELQNRIQEIYDQILNLKVPVPPSAKDYVNPDGTTDEEGYRNAFNEYEWEKWKYDSEVNQLQLKASELQNELVKINMEIQRQTRNLDQLEQNVNAAKTIQDLIDNADNKNLITRLKTLLNSLYKNVKAQDETNQTLDQLYDSMNNEPVPVPPSTSDYNILDADGITTLCDFEAYNEALAEYEKEKKEYELKIQQYNELARNASNTLTNLTDNVDVIVFTATVSVVENKVTELRKSGNKTEANELENKLNKLKSEFNSAQRQKRALLNRQNMLIRRIDRMKVPVPPSASDYKISANGCDIVDEEAFSNAMKDYERQKAKYDRIMNNINRQLDIISERISNLDVKIDKIQSEILSLT